MSQPNPQQPTPTPEPNPMDNPLLKLIAAMVPKQDKAAESGNVGGQDE